MKAGMTLRGWIATYKKLKGQGSLEFNPRVPMKAGLTSRVESCKRNENGKGSLEINDGVPIMPRMSLKAKSLAS